MKKHVDFKPCSIEANLATQSGASSSSKGGVRASSWMMSSVSELVERPTPWRMTCAAYLTRIQKQPTGYDVQHQLAKTATT